MDCSPERELHRLWVRASGGPGPDILLQMSGGRTPCRLEEGAETMSGQLLL